ncbi:MAG: 4Fe-4S dicluster domain-containing protein, partial [Clostridia bacterium]|nr:4Fe-4S dicluster domain-containing protein [Clostridia bacterium]
MSIIQLKEADCRNCYKCIRSCPVKSITFHDDQARILEEECVLCGKCTLICPQNAKQIASDLDGVRAMLERRERVVVSLAPSFIAAFPGCTFEQVAGALLRLGFAAVEETAIGATQVSEAYADILERHSQENLITTCCPTVVRLVQKYFPDLLPQLAHVASPAVAHARLLREAYGKDAKVCFIGPCISKKQEAKDSGEIDAVLMFGEVHDWLAREGVEVARQQAKEARAMHRTISRLYPVPGGIIKTIPAERRRGYTAIAVDGLDRCIRVLQDIRESRISGYLLELSSCVDSCVGGPAMHEYDRAPSFLLSKEAVYGFSRREETGAAPQSEALRVPMGAAYPSLHRDEPMPTEEEIAAILRSIGKVSPSDMLNCGGCGYDTCREKAIAVYRGKANVRMCLPYMR